MRHQRSVEWITDSPPRDVIDQDLLYSLGTFLTVCRISRNDTERRIKALLTNPPTAVLDDTHPVGSTTVTEPEEVADAAVDLAEIGRDQIRRRLAERFKGHEEDGHSRAGVLGGRDGGRAGTGGAGVAVGRSAPGDQLGTTRHATNRTNRTSANTTRARRTRSELQ